MKGPQEGYGVLPGLPAPSLSYRVHPHCTQSGPTEIHVKLQTRQAFAVPRRNVTDGPSYPGPALALQPATPNHA